MKRCRGQATMVHPGHWNSWWRVGLLVPLSKHTTNYYFCEESMCWPMPARGKYWQIWVKEINQTVQNHLFHEDITIRDRARKTFCKQIDSVITVSYGEELCVTHNCLNENNDVVRKQEMVQNIFQEQDPCTFQCAPHKELWLKSREDLCHALTVKKSFPHQTLSTVVFNCGETLSFQATGYKTTGQIQLFHFPKRG